MPRAILIIGACLSLLVAGCGDDSSTTAETSGTTTEEQSAPPTTTEEEASGEKAAEEAEKRAKPKFVNVPDGAPPSKLVVKDLEEGTGPTAKTGDEVTVNYLGIVYKTGEQFDASWDRGEPFPFTLGSGAVIAGWEQGLEGMKVGGRRQLIIPPNLAYGAQALPGIPPNSTLVFVVDLLAVR
ncbi:MAG TPA: FKBP-type peptidyl-prolyl cis-trans isomerase [Solirubrobacterales bacterium]|nr:FKBP-type peptidyl-prolyl cis-trans isomerase [Solirubrobacterales bacterium]